MCTETSRDVLEGMSNLWGAYAGKIVTNHKTAFLCRPITGLEKYQGEGEIIDMKKAPLLRRAALNMTDISKTLQNYFPQNMLKIDHMG